MQYQNGKQIVNLRKYYAVLHYVIYNKRKRERDSDMLVQKSTFSTRLKQLIAHKDVTLTELAAQVGTTQASLSRYLRNQREPKADVIQRLANYFNVEIAWLLGFDEKQVTNKKAVKIPVLGKVAAGIPIEAIEDILDYEEISEKLASTGTFFALRIKGDSMTPKIQDGDTVIVRQQNTAKSGDIVIAKVNGDDACCKRLVINSQGVILQSFNTSYEPMFFTKEEVMTRPVTIIGKVVELRRKM